MEASPDLNDSNIKFAEQKEKNRTTIAVAQISLSKSDSINKLCKKIHKFLLEMTEYVSVLSVRRCGYNY